MKIWLKRIGYVIGAIVALILIVVSVVYGMSESQFRRTYSVAGESIAFSTDSAVIARGAHLTSTIGCTDCHGEALAGKAVIDAPPMGRLIAPNLTRGKGGVGDSLTAGSIERTVRHGVLRNGRSVMIMPSPDYQHLSNEDMIAIVSYVHALPPVDNVQAPNNVMLLPRALMVAGQLPLMTADETHPPMPHPQTIAAGVTREYGDYLTQVGGCRGCHGDGLSGGKIPGGDPSWGPAANLTPSAPIGTWTEDQFIQTLRTGKRPDGSPLKAPMPFKQVGRMTDDELKALWSYIHSVPPREFGNR